MASAMTLIEALVAVAVLGIALVGMMSGISYMRFENRAASQRLLVASAGAQILELFKALPYNDIVCTTGTAPIYLEGFGTSTPNTAWSVPQAGQWQALPVEDVNSTSAGTPSIVANKIPQGVWTVQITSPVSPTGIKQITVTIDWQLYAGSTRPPESYSISTMVCSGFPNL
jgi:type II secretory pathway pseudopilin PulG